MQVWAGREASGHLFQNGVVTIGSFDGLHLGHQSLLKRAADFSGPKVVITFDPHPLQVLTPQREIKRLFPREDVLEQLPNFAVDLAWIIPFDRAFAEVRAGDFLQTYLKQELNARTIVAGYDFAVGANREGTLNFLRHWANQNAITLSEVPPLELEGGVVSSRRIRDLVLKGEVGQAQRLLGRPFYLRGQVVSGAGRGSQIGIPTLNQQVVNETLPANGVYVTRTICEGRTYPSVTNIGVNPTFSGNTIKVESHILNAKVEARGLTIDVQLLEYLRPEIKFVDVKSLQQQIQKDIAQASLRLGVGQ